MLGAEKGSSREAESRGSWDTLQLASTALCTPLTSTSSTEARGSGHNTAQLRTIPGPPQSHHTPIHLISLLALIILFCRCGN